MVRAGLTGIFPFAFLLVLGWGVGAAEYSAERPNGQWELPTDEEQIPTHYIVHKSMPAPPPLPISCSDWDGDGYSPDGGICGLIDCDDTDPDVNPGAPEVCDGIDNDCDGAIEEHFMYYDSIEYCFDMIVGEAWAGEPIPVRAYGYNSSARTVMSLTPIDSALTHSMRYDCYSTGYCVWDTVLPAHPFPGTYPVQGRLMKDKYRSLASFVQNIEVVCPDEYCEPEPLYYDFVTWMREKGYKESIINHYADIRLNVNAVQFRQDLFNRPMGITQPWVIDVFDLIPTDTEATYVGMDIGEGPDCTPAYSWPDFCSPVQPVDYKFIEAHFEKTFGMDFEFVYNRIEMDYTDVLGEPELLDYGWYRFPFPYSFRDSFPKHSIVHFAMTRWLGTKIDGTTTGAGAAFIQRPLESLTTPLVITHEWGHTFGMSHPFIGSYVNKDYWGLNSVMDNSYRTGPRGLFDPTDPYERYIFEPDNGYVDEGLYAAAYNEHIIGSTQMPACGMVDPEILGVTVVAETVGERTYRITLANLGNIAVNYVPLAAFDGDGFGALIEERIIDRIKPGVNLEYDFTVAKSMLGSGVAAFVIDKDDLIAEISDHPETACLNPIRCGDVNNNGFVNASDIIGLVNYVFKSGVEPFPLWIADVNGDGRGVTSADILYMVNHIFKGGPVPVCSAT